MFTFDKRLRFKDKYKVVNVQKVTFKLKST